MHLNERQYNQNRCYKRPKMIAAELESFDHLLPVIDFS